MIEYQTQQHQLFTILSHTFALFFTGKGQEAVSRAPHLSLMY